MPSLPPGAFTRSRLENRLDEAARRRLTLVTAAPGLGKTTLLAGWASHKNCAWYTVGPDDRDPAVLAHGLLEATRLRAPALNPAVVGPPSTGGAWSSRLRDRARWAPTMMGGAVRG